MTETPLSDVAIGQQFPRFVEALRARLDVGRREYGDESLRRAPEELLGELAEEAMDLAGWGFLLWSRIQTVLGRVAEARPITKEREELASRGTMLVVDYAVGGGDGL